MWEAAGKAAIACACAGVIVLYCLYPDRAPELLAEWQFVILQVVFAATAALLLAYTLYSWLRSVNESQQHKRRLKMLDKTAEEVRMRRLQLELETAEKVRSAAEESELRRREAALKAAQLRAELKAISAQRQPGGGQVKGSQEDLASVRARQQAEAARAQQEHLLRLQEKEEQEREKRAAEAAALRAEAKAQAAARQPGGGAVHASVSASVDTTRACQQQQGSAPASLSSRGAGSRGGTGTDTGTGIGTHSRQQRTWDGPVFPGDELRGWVSPASEEAARLRAQQDAELAAALARDRAREEARLAKARAAEEAEERKRQEEQARQERRAVLVSLLPPEPTSAEAQERATVAVRFPDSTVRRRTWLRSHTVGDLYNWVESEESMVLKQFQLARPFPREVIARESSSQTLEEGHLFPQALVVVELLD